MKNVCTEKFPLICLWRVNGNDESTCRDDNDSIRRCLHKSLYKVFYIIAHRTPNVACARLINMKPATDILCPMPTSMLKATAIIIHNINYHFICIIIYMWTEILFCKNDLFTFTQLEMLKYGAVQYSLLRYKRTL